MTQTRFTRFTFSKRLLRTTVCTALLAGSMSACVPLVVGGAVVGGVIFAVDRRTSGAQLDDKGIELRGRNRVKTALAGRAARVKVTSYNRMALLTGQVSTEADRTMVENAVRAVPNVRHVVNEVIVGPLAANPTSDALITGRVRTALLGTKNVRSGAVKITTENAVVYMMGLVNSEESARAAAAASRVIGVAKVVKVFELTDAPMPHPIGVPDNTGQTGRSVGAPVAPAPAYTPAPAGSTPAPYTAPIGNTTSP